MLAEKTLLLLEHLLDARGQGLCCILVLSRVDEAVDVHLELGHGLDCSAEIKHLGSGRSLLGLDHLEQTDVGLEDVGQVRVLRVLKLLVAHDRGRAEASRRNRNDLDEKVVVIALAAGALATGLLQGRGCRAKHQIQDNSLLVPQPTEHFSDLSPEHEHPKNPKKDWRRTTKGMRNVLAALSPVVSSLLSSSSSAMSSSSIMSSIWYLPSSSTSLFFFHECLKFFKKKRGRRTTFLVGVRLVDLAASSNRGLISRPKWRLDMASFLGSLTSKSLDVPSLRMLGTNVWQFWQRLAGIERK